MSFEAGHKLAHYEVIEPIGRGGMGEVYRAKDGKLGREVAIKVLPEELARDGERLNRFEREARLLAQLNHTNIATLHGLEEHGDQHFLVMELVEGETLAERIAQGPLPIDEAVPLFIQIAEGLEAAHEKGIIHRDLKPANIKIRPNGKPKILDFGLAKAFRPDVDVVATSSQLPTVTKETASGVILGTAAYMSPEQARGKSVDKRTDIWAFGCCLYESLTGRAAFLGDTFSDTLAKVLTEQPRWEALPVNTPFTVRRLLRHALAKDPSERLKDIGDAFLGSLEEPPPVGGGRARRGTAERVVWIAVVVVLSAVAFFAWRRAEPRRVDESARFAIDRVGPATTPTSTFVDVSRDGTKLLYVKMDDGVSRVYIRPLDSLNARSLDGTEDAAVACFSPDGEAIAFDSPSGVQTVQVEGGPPETFSKARVVGPFDIDWVDADTVVVTDQQTFFRIRRGSSTAEPMASPDVSSGERAYRHPQLLPGADSVLLTIGTSRIDSWDEASISVLDLATGERKIVIENGVHPTYVSTGHLLFVRAGEIFAAPFDLESREVTGSAVSVQKGIYLDTTFGTTPYAISETGTLIYASGTAWTPARKLAWVDRDGRARALDVEPGPITRVALSPNGRFIAFDRNAANVSIWIHEIQRGTTVRFTHEWTHTVPIWTPDGRYVTYTSFVGLERRLVRKPLDGASEAEVLLDSAPSAIASSWSPDGEELFFHGRPTPNRDNDIGVVRSRSPGEFRTVIGTPYNERRAMISPSGRWLAYQSDETGQYEIYVQGYPDGKRYLASRGGGQAPLWSRDGTELFFRTERGSVMAVDFRENRDPPLLVPRLLFEGTGFRGGDSRTYDVSPDGRRFLMVLESETPPTSEIVVVLNWLDALERLVPTEKDLDPFE